MEIALPEGIDSEAVVKRMFWLAWNACGGTFAAGALRDNPGATEDQVWENVQGPGDYTMTHSSPGKAYGDYVFGRMVKTCIVYAEGTINMHDDEPQRDYQAWCAKYPTYESLARAAIDELTVKA